MAIEIKFLSNIVSFLRGTKDMSSSLDDVADSLDDVARDAAKAGSKAGDEISDGAKEGERSVDRLERSFKDMADTARRESKTAGDSMGRDMKTGSGQAGEAVKEFGDEAKQNIAETFSSFRGEAEDFAQIAQDTFGGVISNLGPVGVAAGVAGALGIGMIMSEFEKAKEKEQEFRERVAELTQVLIDTGGEGADAVAHIADQLAELAAPTDDGARSLAQIRLEAEKAQIPFTELANAYAGGQGSLTDYMGQLDELIAMEQRRAREATEGMEGSIIGTTTYGLELEKIRDNIKGVAEEQEAAAEAERLYMESGGALALARSEAMGTLQGELDESIGVWNEYKDAETGALDPAGYLAAMEARMSATANFNTNVQTIAAQFGLSFEETQAILDQGVDFAPMLQSIIDAGLGEQFAGQVQAAVGGGQEIIDGTPLGATVTVDAETGTAQAQLDETAEARETTVEAIPEVSRAQRALDEVATKNRTATITAVANTATASNAIDRLVEDRLVTIRTRVLDPRGVEVP